MYLVHAYAMCLLPGVPAYVVLLGHWLRSLARCVTSCVITSWYPKIWYLRS